MFTIKLKPSITRAAIAMLFMVGEPLMAQQTKNIIIITTDGFRWQELFKGMDETLVNDPKMEHDRAYILKNYGGENEAVKREKLMPFFWKYIQKKGRIYGNREFKNFVNNANPYWFSYPGYNEIFTGYADTTINSNEYPPNPNINVLAFLNKQPALRGKVAAFGGWNAYDRILNEEQSGIPVTCGFEKFGGPNPDARASLLNEMLANSFKPFGDSECLDMFTHYGAMEYLKKNKPNVLYIGYGETDEWAHAGFYRSYLDAVHQVDNWIKEIWDYVQSDPQYKNKTTLFITTDHGRGDKIKSQWTDHGNQIQDASEIWFAVLGPDTPAEGEMKRSGQYYQKQFAQTIAKLMGYTFTANHPVAEAIKEVNKK